ncbi:DUF6114 domain-containing protein [Saccharothrix australiensis]|uniref:Uncharacterized protein n=1 Tax=Saccharothrix australiensis TaxID=2072 RepID=A0A495W0I0_9PSEU|nr:DUF6114 domain-containing protein [Saccharothrix australiensis]RKT54517.1 hypothetical protein C8E97_3160 [Saccharothrix australiensis]
MDADAKWGTARWRAWWRRTCRAWRGFRDWRRSRPFTAGALLVLSGVVIALPPYAGFRVGDVLVSITTVGGVSALLIGALLGICGLSLWLRPRFRFAAGVAAALLSLVALVVTNLGGFVVGTLAGLVGAALALAWTDRPRPPRRSVPRTGSSLLVVIAAAAGTGAPSAREVPAGRSWTVSASAVRLEGVAYHGIDRVVVDGRPTRAMRFTAHRVEVTDAVQVGDLGNGHELVITTARDATPAVAGSVDLFALRVTGVFSVLGLIGIPFDFTPDHPPPLVPSAAVLTDVTAVNALASGSALAVPDAELVIR